MSVIQWTQLLVTVTFGIYVGIAILTRVASTRGFYVAGQGVPAVLVNAPDVIDAGLLASVVPIGSGRRTR